MRKNYRLIWFDYNYILLLWRATPMTFVHTTNNVCGCGVGCGAIFAGFLLIYTISLQKYIIYESIIYIDNPMASFKTS